MLRALRRVPVLSRASYRTVGIMSSTAFIKAAEKADRTLAGSNEKDGAAIAGLVKEQEGSTNDLDALNKKITPLTYLHGNAPTSADVALYTQLHPIIAGANAGPVRRVAHPALLRYFLQVQSIPAVEAAQKELPNDFQPVNVDLSSLPKPEKVVIAPVKKEKKDKKGAAPPAEGVVASVQSAVGSAVEAGTAAVAAAGATVAAAVESAKAAVVGEEGAAAKGGKKEKKEKKEKPAKTQPAKEEPSGPAPSMIEMRVGKVLDVKKHPDAESLYVEQIDVGEAEPRTVCSGLVKYMTEDQIRGATIVVICNLKPATMRGVKSMAMLLCATSADGKDAGIEFVLPPEGSQPGERIYFEGEKYENATPETQLNPKKKIFETIQPGFTTLESREAAWVNPETKEVHRIRTKDGICKAASFVGASLS